MSERRYISSRRFVEFRRLPSKPRRPKPNFESDFRDRLVQAGMAWTYEGWVASFHRYPHFVPDFVCRLSRRLRLVIELEARRKSLCWPQLASLAVNRRRVRVMCICFETRLIFTNLTEDETNRLLVALGYDPPAWRVTSYQIARSPEA